jgi:hypothetical protein
MFHIDDRYSGKEKRNSIGYLHKNELERQKLRKKLHPITRELDNFFNHKLHQRGWWPNGLFLRKQYYYYAKPGLGCYYEKNNVEQLKDLGELKKETKKNILKNFIEYNYIEDNQYVITIEYCSNCEEHITHTFHSAEVYKNYAISLQKCILLRFPFIKVILKPIETDILKQEHYKLPKVDLFGNSEKKYVNDKFKDVRIGAFEIQICYKKVGSEVKKALLHSKLQTKQFPEITKVLDKIVSYLPNFTGQIVTYEKEEDIENSKKNNLDDINAKGFLEGLQINIYLLNNPRIKNISTEAWNEIQTQQDPHKRSLMIKEQKLLTKEKMFKNNSIMNMKNNRVRPLSSISGYKSLGKLRKSQSAKNIERPSTSKTFLLGNNNRNISNNNNTSLLSRSLIHKNTMNNYILDKNEANNLKGKLILTKYTNNEGLIDIGPLPYDSYFIEVQESRQYRSIGFVLKFNSLNLKNKNFIKKYLGLFIQENSFIQLNIYEVNKDKNGVEDPVHLGQAKVTLKRLYNFDEQDNNNNLENNFQENEENSEFKITLNEKLNAPGIFEHTVAPGQYLLEVEKQNYETIRKFIDLEKGSNTINVEMSVERCCNLHIFVYNYEKFQEEANVPIHNVDVAIYQSANEVLEESITNDKGEVNYLVNKGEDFLTVVVSKLGYYPVQRVFIRNKEAPINEKGEYEENLIFFLVKESFILNNNCILCVTYSNLYDINFDPNSIQISDNIKNKLSLSCYDGQQENGVISTFIQYQPKLKNAPINENNNNNNEQAENEGNEEQNNNNVNENNEIGNNNENNNNENHPVVEDDEESTNNNKGENAETENYDNIISLSFIIQTESLKFNNYQDKGFTMNGLERFGCQTIIYMPKNMFYLSAPKFCNEGYCIWNLGWVDVKNQLFYQTNTLTESLDDRILHFSGWLEFLQSLIDDKIYTKLFEFFCFDKSSLNNGDRLINEDIFVQNLKELKFCKNNDEDIIEFILNIFRCSNRVISFNLVKRKISSNLKNFSDEALAEGNMADDNNIDNSSQMNNNEANQEIVEENNE